MMDRGRRGTIFRYGDVAMALQPMTQRNQNGHVLAPTDSNEAMDDMPAPQPSMTSRLKCSAQVPIIICFFLIITYIGLGSLLLVIMEDLSFVDGLHLIINLLLTLGFAHLLPGMNGEQSGAVAVKSTSQLSLIVITFLILFGMTLLSSSFNVWIENRNNTKTVTYHHIASPGRQRVS